MRLIDADALMESIGCADAVKYGNRDRAQQDISYSTRMLYEIRGEIDAQPTVGGWISVQDRLPEKNVPVLVYEKHGYVYVDRLEAECAWQIAITPSIVITHWMPLPEPPKEERGDD